MAEVRRPIAAVALGRDRVGATTNAASSARLAARATSNMTMTGSTGGLRSLRLSIRTPHLVRSGILAAGCRTSGTDDDARDARSCVTGARGPGARVRLADVHIAMRFMTASRA